ncbi:MAG: NADPH-dependent assimilatory sulfite reductase hemoprotein subunit [Alphaproteobacteria bacterium]|nr:NADPH-dependent assimilatory sulfite reductase hemoprotein subunit [Alphaproteobacteria bacterium]
MSKDDKLSEVEHIKIASRGLRGGIAATLDDESAIKFSESDEKLTKFLGFYQGYNRDTATERKKAGLDKEWEVMLRAKIPGGRLLAHQYLALDGLVDQFSNGTLRVTSRQGLQFHHVMKGNIRPLLRTINEVMLSTLGGCGDVVRNTIAVPSPVKKPMYREIEETAKALSRATLPSTGGYHELWVDGEKIDTGASAPKPEEAPDPLYGKAYLPRKFKIALAVPEDNTVDALANDIALIALHDGENIHGYNVYIGGGFGMKHNNAETYPRLASPLGSIDKADVMALCMAIIKFQSEHGDRGDRQHARMKYVVAEKGTDFCRDEIEKNFGKTLNKFEKTGPLKVIDHLGWHEQGDGRWYLGVPVLSGRIKDTDEHRIRTAFREIARIYDLPMILMPTEDVIFCDITEDDKADITTLLQHHKVPLKEDHLPAELWAMSCVALPTCGKALTEGERARVPIVKMVTDTLAKHDLEQEKIAVRITGCPNGCSRPYTGDIGIVGRAPGIYSIFLGGDFEGTRLSHKVADMVKMEQIGDFLEPFIASFAKERTNDNEGFGDFCERIGDERRKMLAAQSGAAKKL